MKYFYILSMFLMTLQIHGRAQNCTTKSDKIITEQATYNVPCVTFTARDNIDLKPGFSFSSTYAGQPQALDFTWPCSWCSSGTSSSGWTGSITINSTTVTSSTLSAGFNFSAYYGSIQTMASTLRTNLGSGWNIYVSAYSVGPVTFRNFYTRCRKSNVGSEFTCGQCFRISRCLSYRSGCL
jgi:hypothetical protein